LSSDLVDERVYALEVVVADWHLALAAFGGSVTNAATVVAKLEDFGG
jgi:hypothetical protein